MRILFDNGTPAPLIPFLAGHTVTKAITVGWDGLENGELIRKAEEAGYEILLSTDKNIRYQQNLKGRRIALVVRVRASSAVERQGVLRGRLGWVKSCPLRLFRGQGEK